jgi:hypothetical protein
VSASFSVAQMPKSEKEIQAAIRQKFMESQAQQEEQVKQQQNLLAQEMERQNQLGVLGRLDLRPFAQALQQYGSTTAVAPASAPTDRLEAIKQLQEQVQRGQRGLTQDQIGFLRTIMEDRRAAQLRASEEKADKNFGLRVRTSLNSSEEAKKVRAVGDLNTKIGTLIEKISKKGASLTGEDKADLDSAFQDVKVAWKDSAGLGAIQKEDANLIEQAIGDSPTTFKGLTGYALIGGKKGLTAKLEGIRKRAVTQGLQHLDSATAAFPYDEAKPILMDMSKKLQVPKTETELLMEKAAKLQKELEE